MTLQRLCPDMTSVGNSAQRAKTETLQAVAGAVLASGRPARLRMPKARL